MAYEPLPWNENASYRVDCASADVLEADPSLLRIPLANVDRWLAIGMGGTACLESWRRLLMAAQTDVAAFREVLRVLRSTDERDLEFKGFSPVSGLLNKEQRKALARECTYSH
jgi:hypothetical protein